MELFGEGAFGARPGKERRLCVSGMVLRGFLSLSSKEEAKEDAEDDVDRSDREGLLVDGLRGPVLNSVVSSGGESFRKKLEMAWGILLVFGTDAD